MENKKNIICLCGSLNQTVQLHKISEYLKDEYDIYFTQVFGEGLFYKVIAESGILDNTVMGKSSSFTKVSREYITNHGLNYDYRAKSKGIKYDLALISTDLIVPRNVKRLKTIWVQEGMIDPLRVSSRLTKKFKLPEYTTGDTSLNGTSNKADIYCAMSYGYKDYFAKWGTDQNKILVTGVPNFDDIVSFNQRPYKENGFVLIATSDIRELAGNDDRIYFFKKCRDIANGRKVIYKPHPNEIQDRVITEMRLIIPDAEIITEPILDTLIAHCDTLITQYSSSVYVGLVLGKTVYSYFPIEELESKKPIQNGGSSARIIADIAREYMKFDGTKDEFIQTSEYVKKFL